MCFRLWRRSGEKENDVEVLFRPVQLPNGNQRRYGCNCKKYSQQQLGNTEAPEFDQVVKDIDGEGDKYIGANDLPVLKPEKQTQDGNRHFNDDGECL